MEDVLARYLDGELNEEEAAQLLRMAAEDSRLERAIREYEMILRAADRLPRRRPRDGFADRVMEALDRPAGERSGKPAASGLRPWYAAAATLILGLFIGYMGSSGSRVGPERTDSVEAAYPAILPVQVALDGSGVGYHRAVRLTYAGSRTDLKSVAVAGSFNGWDPTAAPMTLEQGIWTILLLLPPGDHEYMFVEDGDSWVTDPRAPATRQDGFGGANGLLAVRS